MRFAALLPLVSAALAAALGCASGAAAGPGADQERSGPLLVASFDDARDDAFGGGSIAPPGDTQFQPGDFDLRRLAVLVDGDDVLLEVTLGAEIRVPTDLYRLNSTPARLWNNVYLQNVDIYVDTDPTSPAGHTACVPGRRVAFEPGRTWKRAVILTPQPGLAREVTAGALPVAVRSMLFPDRLQLRGRTLVARIPADQLGGLPTTAWGWSVHVSGATWERNLKVVDRLTGTAEADAFTLPVQGLREAWAFGGAPPGDSFPRVVDVLLPPGGDQRAVLGSWQATGSFAQVPFAYGQPPGLPPPPGAPQAAAPAPPRSEFTVVDVSGSMVTIAGPVKELKPMQLGQVLGPKGEPVARLVVVQVLDQGAVANLVDGGDRILAGARVHFPPVPGPAPTP